MKTKKKVYLIIAVVLLGITGLIFLSNNTTIKSKATAKQLTVEERILKARKAYYEMIGDSNSKPKVASKSTKSYDVLVEIKNKSVCEKSNITEYNKKIKKQEEKVLESQEDVIKQIEKITGNSVKEQVGYLINAVTVSANDNQIIKIKKLNQVKSVSTLHKYYPTMANAIREGNADLQEKLKSTKYTGEGVLIAIIDSGVNYRHKDMILGDNVSTKYSKKQWQEKIKLLGYGKYFTEKVPFGYDYSCEVNECNSNDNIHGCHVAGISAANGETTGVAKNAQIMGMKVFADNLGASEIDVIRAIEDAVKLGADVINMSLGGADSSVVDNNEYLQKTINEASKKGVLCCVAAGNNGASTGFGDNKNVLGIEDSSSLSSPAVTKTALTVASAENVAYRTINELNISLNNKQYTIEGLDIVGYDLVASNDKLVYMEKITDDMGKLTKSQGIKNKIVVANYNGEYLNDKIYKLSQAGVKGIILINDGEFKENNIKDWTGVPVLVIEKSNSSDIVKAAKMSKKITVNNVVEKSVISSGVEMSTFSSWGTTNELDIKPEITAPGGNIKSITSGTDSYEVMSGTSMASPYIAGCEATIINTMSDKGIDLKGISKINYMKNILMNTATPIYEKKTGAPYSVRYQGAGLVNLANAIKSNVTATYQGQAKIELGSITGSKTINIELQNYGNEDARYTMSTLPLYVDYISNSADNNLKKNVYGIKKVDNANITFEKDNIIVPAKGKVSIVAHINIPDNYENNKFVEGFVKLVGDNVVDLNIPVLGFYGDWDMLPICAESVYEDSNVLENRNNIINIESMTGISYFGEKPPYILGEQTTISENVESSIDTNNTNSTNDIYTEKYLKKNAIRTSIGNTEKLVLTGNTTSGIYEVSSDIAQGCCVKPSKEIYPIIKLYNSKGVLLDDNNVWGGMSYSYSFNCEKNEKYYIVISSYENMIGEYSVKFKKTEIDKYKNKLNGSLNVIKIGKKKEIKNAKDYVYRIQPKESGYYTIESEMIDSQVTWFSITERELYTFNDTVDIRYLDGTVDCDKNTLEVYLSKNKVYDLNFRKFNINDNTGKNILIYRSKGDNINKQKSRYCGENVAFGMSEYNNNIHPMWCPVAQFTVLRSSKYMEVNILDSNKKAIRRLAKQYDVSKEDMADLLHNCEKEFDWDGTLYNKATGEYERASEGQYYIQLKSKVTDNSKEQEIIMPIKVDTEAPVIEKCEIEKRGEDSVLKFKASDNIALSDSVGIAFDECNLDFQYLEKKYCELEKDSEGNYIVNIGKMGGRKIYLLVNDAGENMTIKEFNSHANDMDFDIGFYDFKLCEGVTLDNDISAYIGRDNYCEEDNQKYFRIRGNISKNLKIYINDIEEEFCEDEENFSERRFSIKIPYVESDNIELHIVVKNENNKIVFENSYSPNVDIENPELELCDSDSIVEKFCLENIAFIRVKPNTQYIRFNMKDNKDIDINSIEIIDTDSHKYTCKKEKNDTYSIIFDDVIEDRTKIKLNVSDKAKNESTLTFVLYIDNNIFYNDYKDGLLMYDVSFNHDWIECEIIEDKNGNKIYPLTGSFYKMPDLLKINGKEVSIDPKTNTFETNIPVKKGLNKVSFYIESGGYKKSDIHTFMLEDIQVKYLDLPKPDKNGVIHVNSPDFKLKGIISHYASDLLININGNEVFNGTNGLDAEEGNANRYKFSYNTKLKKGKNIISISINDEYQKQIVVNYK